MLQTYIPISSAAQYLGISVRKLRYLIKDPRDPLPFFRIGRSIRFKVEDIDNWMTTLRNHKGGEK